MGIDQLGIQRAASPDPDQGPRMDRRRLVRGTVAASLVGVVGGASAPMTARSADATGHPDALPLPASRFSTGELSKGAYLEASLHVMLQ